MSHLFISYSKKDITFARHLRSRLQDAGFVVWMDETKLVPSERWWPTIERNIITCKAFIVIMSPNSKESDWVEREILVAEDSDHRKPIFPVLLEGKAWSRLGNVQYEDMRAGLSAALRPAFVDALQQYAPTFTGSLPPPPLTDDTVQSTVPPVPQVSSTAASRSFSMRGVLLGVGALVLIAALALIVLPALNPPAVTPTVATPNPTHTENALAMVDSSTPTVTQTFEPSIAASDIPSATFTDAPTATLTNSPEPSVTPSDLPSATFTDLPTNTPTPDEVQREGTLQSVMQNLQTEQAQLQATADRATAQALTATADAWTDTPTPDDRATAAALLTATAVQMAVHQTATADVWTDTPTLTFTPSQTFTPSRTPTFTPTTTPSNTPTATADPLERAFTPVTANSDWTPVTREFDGVTMVLVPVGSFDMGSTDEEIEIGFTMCQQAVDNNAICERSWFDNETPNGDNTQTFSQPFWIDQTEVTRAQYQECVDAGECEQTPASDYSTQPDQPIIRVTWFQADAYCRWHDARLPTEAEWEYAARGPERWLFPWGDTFDGTLANHCDRNCGEASWASGYNYVNEENDDGYAVTAPVGSYPRGASWVGALDMSGNVWEWTSSLYQDYPYDPEDGREADTGDRTDVQRVLRGGSFVNSTDILRASDRSWNRPDGENYVRGFRCARSYNPES
ncbi:MAG: SUMF1/EgtB/PvdO family nonheme iron enzyme [Anaerolinea sp.]|nr:SUMF1/EgtB/PvdO family nonheme iron enzyme [Anaerolinea sp.]